MCDLEKSAMVLYSCCNDEFDDNVPKGVIIVEDKDLDHQFGQEKKKYVGNQLVERCIHGFPNLQFMW